MPAPPDLTPEATQAVRTAAKTVPIAAALTRAALPPLPDGPPALTHAFALVLPSTGWAVFLQHGRSRVLPLFTGVAEVRAFLTSGRVPLCRAVGLATAGAVADFLRSPPGRLAGAGGFLVALDPIDLANLAPVLFTARELIAALAGGHP